MERGHILVVDDEQSARIVLRKILSRDGYRVTEADSGQSGILALRTERPDLVLMDIIMADMDGREAIAEMKRAEGENMPPYIYLTVDPTHEREGLEEGADDYIFKGDMNADKLQIIRLRVENAMLVRNLLDRDALTGLYNHGFFKMPSREPTPKRGPETCHWRSWSPISTSSRHTMMFTATTLVIDC